VQHSQIDGSFDIKLILAGLEYRAQNFRDSTFFPEPSKDQVRADAPDSYRFDFAGGMGVNDSKLLTVPQARTHEPFQLSACYQEV
jgi:hypothetical protein